MTKSIFETIVLDSNANKKLEYAHSIKYAKKRELFEKEKKSLKSIRDKKVILKNLLG